MTSAALGANISRVEVNNISQHGFWLLLDDEELFLPFAEFPWFQDATLGKILHVERPVNWVEKPVARSFQAVMASCVSDLAISAINTSAEMPALCASGESSAPGL